MNAIKSILNNKNSTLLKFDFEFIPLDEPRNENSKKISKILDELSIDVDFEVGFADEDFHVMIFISINSEKEQGYLINAQQFSIYDFAGEITDENEKNFYIQSAIGITINQVREIINNNTITCPFGPYRLPLINVSDLIEKKRETVTKSDIETEEKS